MTFVWMVLALAMTAAPAEQASFLFELRHVPVGTVQLSLSGQRYRYRSHQLFSRGAHRGETTQEASFEVGAQGHLAGKALMPEGLWLWRRRPIGCSRVREELTRMEKEACVERSQGRASWGILGAQPFEARYDLQGLLERLVLGDAVFTRVAAPPGLSPPELFGKGFPVEGRGGRLALYPRVELSPRAPLKPFPVEEARALAQQVRASFEVQAPSYADFGSEKGALVGSCLAHARRFVRLAKERGQEAEVLLGLVVDGGRAYPHAWVRLTDEAGRALELDPTWLEHVTPATHLALGPEGEAGTLFLELLAGRADVVRR
ncbi:MAG: transglutaminase domain-containing protein [Myxococcota bacterium]